MDKLRTTQVNPVVLIGVLVVLGAVAAYAFILRPRQQEARALKEWTSPEAQASRGPNKTLAPAAQTKLQELLAKEGKAGVRQSRRDGE